MATMISTGTDVIAFLKDQHQDIKKALGEVARKSGGERTRAFVTLRRMWTVHETAEEEIIHPAARRALAGGDAIVNARLEEEKDAKTTLYELEKLDCNSVAFEEKFETFKSAVIAHSEAEEREEFAKLGEMLDPGRLGRMRRAVKLAEAFAPTRPHAALQSPAANFLVGPIASLVDRARDALFY